jgi:hypothetical protein
MEIPLTDPIQEIIARIGNPDKRPTSYVFPIIPNGLASLVKRRTDRAKTEAEQIDEIVRQKIKMVNARLKWLCERNDLPPHHYILGAPFLCKPVEGIGRKRGGDPRDVRSFRYPNDGGVPETL